MKSFDFHLEGFLPVFSIWTLIVVTILSALIAWFTYSNYNSFSSKKKALLIIIRISAFIFLVLLLSNPSIRVTKSIIDVPKFAMLIDNSKSVTAEKKTWRGRDSIDSLLIEIKKFESLNADIHYFRIGSSFDRLNTVDDLDFSDGITDLFTPLNELLNGRLSYDGLILISDGIVTRGRNPVFAINDRRIPVHTIGIGDTSVVRDLILAEVRFQNRVQIEELHQIEVNVRNIGFDNMPVEIQLVRNGQVSESKIIVTQHNQSTHFLIFQSKNNNVETVDYEVNIVPVDNEFTTLNNNRAFSVDYVDDKLNILDIAFEIHPDVGAIRRVLDDMEFVNTTRLNWVSGSQFIEGSLPSRQDTLDLVIIYGAPENLQSTLTNDIRNLIETNSLIFVMTPKTSYLTLESLNLTSYMGHYFRGSDQTISMPVFIMPNANLTGHPVLELDAIDWQRIPNIFARWSEFTPSYDGNVFFWAHSRAGNRTAPLITGNSIGNRRVVIVNASGLFTWSNSPDVHVSRSFEKLISNLVSWSSSQTENQNLRITPLQDTFEAGEPIIINADLSDESGLRIDNAEVTVQLSMEESDEIRNYILEPVSPGSYRVIIPSLPLGRYNFEGSANRAMVQLGTSFGTFSVRDSGLEMVNLVRDDNVLNSISERSGGVSIEFDRIHELYDVLSSTISPRETAEISHFYLNRNPIWFLLVILLLGTEWYIRRTVLLP